jgi:hypothetical protein
VAELNVKFNGGLADNHELPAYLGSESLVGISRSVLIVSSYLTEGQIRRRRLESLPTDLRLKSIQRGSFETVFEWIVPAAPYLVGGGLTIAGGVLANLATDMLKRVYQRAVGAREDDEIGEHAAELIDSRSGDIDALVQAVEPSVRLFHNVINNGVININVGKTGGDYSIGNFNSKTKNYVNTNIFNEEVRVKRFSISRFNSNSGEGGAFDFSEGRVVPFQLDQSADPQSLEAILQSFGNYARVKVVGADLNSTVALKYDSVDSGSGRTKKIIVYQARSEIDELG